MRLVFLGPPGSGKGTQAQILKEKHGFIPLSTGDMLRMAVEAQGGLGLQAKDLMDSGKLVPDEIVNRIVAEEIMVPEYRERFILDGYPRTVSQAQALSSFLQDEGFDINAVILFDIPEDYLVDRVKTRIEQAIQSGNAVRSDDNVDVFRQRLIEYKEKTHPLVEFYKKEEKLRVVDGAAPVEGVTAKIEKVLGLH